MIEALKGRLAAWRMSAGALPRIWWSRVRGRSFVPHPRTFIFIEPTTHCNLECKFCTYRMDLRPHAVMGLDRFADYARQALEMGFEDAALTPINGDVFVDKAIMDKIRFLAAQPKLKGILVYTNFIAAAPEAIAEIMAMDKIRLFNISIYGHDQDSFERIAGRGEGQFRRLLDNLDRLADGWAGACKPQAFQACIRTARDFDLASAQGPLADRLRRLRSLGMDVSVQSRCDDWGGLIGPDDMAGLNMDLVHGRSLVKSGPCTLPFYSVQILADGRVNACACRDIAGELIIGDMNKQSLSSILSADNPAYVDLIDRQERGDFPDACKGCSFYRSIYDPAIAGTSPKGAMSLAEFKDFLKS